jgi:hypothetical protein
VAHFLLERYVPRADGGAFLRGEERARVAVAELTQIGTAIRLLHSVFVPEDEMSYYLYEADSVETVREAARRAALPYERIATAIPGS